MSDSRYRHLTDRIGNGVEGLGDPGTNGVLKEKKNGGFVVITHGNPANMPMYETVKELQDRLTEIAKEVFS